jgi:hypothetical protein
MDEAATALDASYPTIDQGLAADEFHGIVPLHSADAAHSAANIARWNTYLPCACVRTMIRMGWDYST